MKENGEAAPPRAPPVFWGGARGGRYGISSRSSPKRPCRGMPVRGRRSIRRQAVFDRDAGGVHQGGAASLGFFSARRSFVPRDQLVRPDLGHHGAQLGADFFDGVVGVAAADGLEVGLAGLLLEDPVAGEAAFLFSPLCASAADEAEGWPSSVRQPVLVSPVRNPTGKRARDRSFENPSGCGWRGARH